ncbi:MAG TPA: DUF3467 domain-containing protein [Roseomonas sp.]|nr:DUF3467 domain-containing protein [Roseomonas sp.]
MSDDRSGLKTTISGQTKIKWDDSKLRTTYANVCNVATTREEVMVLFGTSQAWMGSTEEVTVALTDRVLLNPHAAKRLAAMLNKTIEEFEKAYGSLG